MKCFFLRIFFMVCVSLVFGKGKMENSGDVAPSPYYRFPFGVPSGFLDIAKRYLRDDPVIVEAGAYDGKESCTLADFWPVSRVYSFEPVRELFFIAQENTKNNPRISIYNFALGDCCGKMNMYLSSEDFSPHKVSMSSSLYPPKEHLLYSATLFEGVSRVDVTTLDVWAVEQGIPKVDMLWLDMQGFELPALKASPKILSGVSVIVTELEFVEAYAGQALYQEVKDWLEKAGFILIAGNFDFPKDPNQWFGDGLFIRHELLDK